MSSPALFLVRLTDHADKSAVRSQFLEAHKAWLAENRERVRAAGLLHPDTDQPAVGACWIVAAERRAEVEQLVQSDPFHVHGLRASCEILHWSRGFPTGAVSI